MPIVSGRAGSKSALSDVPFSGSGQMESIGYDCEVRGRVGPVRLFRLPGVHRPLGDTWMLADALRRESVDGARVIDLCSGTGALAISAARAGAASVIAVDLTLRATITAWINARLHRTKVRVRRGDLFAPLEGETFDFIVSNPPYIPAETDHLPRRGSRVPLDAGRDGRALLDRICREAPAHLRPSGVILLIHSSICDDEQTCAALREAGLEAQVIVRRPGVLGPVMSSRAAMLRKRGLLGPDDIEDLVIVRGQLASSVASTAGGGAVGDGGIHDLNVDVGPRRVHRSDLVDL